jgi:hypothetical protein
VVARETIGTGSGLRGKRGTQTYDGPSATARTCGDESEPDHAIVSSRD